MSQLNKRIPKLLLIVTDREYADKVSALLKRHHIIQHYQFLAEGTATSEWKDVLGIGASDKTVSVCVGFSTQIKFVLNELKSVLMLNKPGRGIAFVLPVVGISHPLAKMLDDETKMEIEKRIENEMKQMKEQSHHDMIWAILNQGYSEELMKAAHKAGAMGGTVIHARRVGPDAPMKFWGISVQEEKEIIFILTDKEHKRAIMQAVSEGFGIRTEAQGVVFALPVEEIAGADSI